VKTRIQHPAYRIQNEAALSSNVTSAWHALIMQIGKRTGFSRFETALTHLFPHDSTQVVDFPLLSQLRVFWLRVERGGGQWKVDNWQWIAKRGNESNRTNGTNLKTERSLMFAYVRVKSLMFAILKKSIFFQRCGRSLQGHNGWGCYDS